MTFFNEEGAAHLSQRQDWGTPQNLYNELYKEFKFQLDVCANSTNAKCLLYYDETINGLTSSWKGFNCFMNPPFNREIGLWIAKAHEENKKGALVVAVIPARTDTRYWHDHIEGIAEVRFIRGRLKYELPNVKAAPAPFPSCIVIWRRKK